MRDYLKAGVLAALAISLGAAVAPAPAMSQTVLRFADYGPNRGTRAENVEWFLDEIENRSDGRIKIERHWAQSLLSATKLLEGVKTGVATIATVTASYDPNGLYGYLVGDLPVRNPDEVAGALALYDLSTNNELLQSEFDKLGIEYIANYTVGPIQLICSGDPVEHVEGLAGKKIRAVGDWNEIFASLGAVPVSLPTSQAYQALDSGLIDCSQTYGYLTESYKLYEVGDTFVEIDGGTIQSNAIFMNKAAFNALDPKDQATIKELGRELTEKNAVAVRTQNRAVIDKLPDGIEGYKISVTVFDDEDRAKIEAAGQPFIDAYIADGPKNGADGAALVDEYKALIAKYLASQGK